MILPKKLAIFVEGQTEQMFVEKLVKEIAGYKKISIDVYQFQGSKSNRIIKPINSCLEINSPFFVLLYDCGSDSHVVSDIKKQHSSLSNNGYTKIIGLRDLYPKPLDKKAEIEQGIRGLLKPLEKTGIPIFVNLAVMEIEAWFLAEWNYFYKIDNRLTSDFIFENCGLELKSIDVEQIPHPSQDLDNIYRLINRNYDKSETTSREIVEYLDYEFLYLHLVNRVTQIKKFITDVDSFLV